MKIKKGYLAVIVVVLIVIGGYYWYQKSQSSENQTQYVTATVQKGTLINSITTSGNVALDQSATVDPTISGTVASLSVKVGDGVEEGQFLFEIINDDLEVNVKKAETSYEQAKNSLESAEIAEDEAEANYEVAKKKDKKDPTTYTRRQLEVLDDKVDLAEEQIIQAQKNLEAVHASYQNERENAAKRTVTAPITGTVNEINIKNGDDLGKTSSTSTKLTPIIIGDLNTLKASVQVNEVDIPNISIGQKVTLKFDALADFTATGRVEKIDSLGTITQNVVTYNVTIGFDSLDSRIKPEMSVSASIITDVKQDVLTVPNAAIKTEGSDNYVEILKGQTPEKISVHVGETNNTDTEIISGVKERDKVIVQTINSSENTNSNSSSSSQNNSGFRLPGLGGGPRD